MTIPPKAARTPGVSHRWVLPGTEDAGYLAARRLRFEVLRRPLGMPPGSERNPAEDRCWHLVAEDDTEGVVGCLIFRDDGDGTGQLMQMAVGPAHQGRGIGASLVCVLERRAADQGVRRVTLHAREVAVGFYARLGYAVHGAPYTEVGLPHRHMARDL